MKTCISCQPCLVTALLTAALLFGAIPTFAQGTSAPPAQAISDTNGVQEALHATRLLQDQVRALQQSVEDYRTQSENVQKQNEASMKERLGSIENSLDDQRQALDDQRQRELKASQTMMLVAGAFALAGLAAVLMTSWLQMRAVQKLTEVSTQLRLGSGATPFALGEGAAPDAGKVAGTRQRYLEEVQRLQDRIHELEHIESTDIPGNGHPAPESPKEPPTPIRPVSFESSPPAPVRDAQFAVLLGKGQTFLNLDQAEKALASFDEALALQPDHVEALIKRGAALERLQRFDEAIAVYDRVIGLDQRQTTAYLLKGGVFNKLKRFNDALTCYDMALRSQPERKS